LLRARTDHRQFKERRFARGRQRRPAAPQANGEEKGSGFRSLSQSLSRSSSNVILVLILIAIFVDKDYDKDWDKEGKPVDDYGDDYGLRGEAE
jgi:hypothetical protein